MSTSLTEIPWEFHFDEHLQSSYISPESLTELDGRSTFSVRESLIDLLYTTKIGILFDVVQVILSVASFVCWVIESYILDKADEGYYALYSSEVIFAVFFTFDYTLHMFVSPSMHKFIFTYPGKNYNKPPYLTIPHHKAIIDLLSTLPSYVYLSLDIYRYSGLRWIYTVTGATRIWRLYRLLLFTKDAVTRQAIKLVVVVLGLVIFTTGVFVAIEEYQLEFHQALYFVVVTFTTVGYGDYAPKSVQGQMVMIIFIVISFLVIPYQISQLWMLFSSSSEYTGRTKRTNHFMVSGNITPDSISVCLSQLYYKGHFNQKVKTVILGGSEPSLELVEILRFPFYRYHVIYLKGSLTVNSDLKRTCAQRAEACFILTNKYGKPDEEDAANVMRAIAMKKHNFNAHVIVQLNSIVNKSPLQAEGIRSITCIDELKLNTMAHSCLCPGFLALLTNLLFMHHVPSQELNAMSPWEQEYARGLEHGFYNVKFSSYFVGMVFTDAARVLYKEGVVLFGVVTVTENNEAVVLLNPGGYVIQDTDDAYLICCGRVSASRVSTFHPNSTYRSLDRETDRIEGKQLDEVSKKEDEKEQERKPLMSGHERTKSWNKEHTAETEPPKKGQKTKKYASRDNQRYDASTTITDSDDIYDDIHWDTPPPPELLKPSRPYYLLRTARTMEEAMPQSMVGMKDHILVVGALRGIEQFVRHLRLTALEYRPIVIIHRKPLSQKNWQKLHKFPNLYFIRGSGLDHADLKRAMLKTARCAVVLKQRLSSSFTREELPTADSLTIMTALAIQQEARKRAEKIRIIVELVFQENIRFLQKSPQFSSLMDNFQFSPEFASGNLYWACCLDSLTCQTYYNAHLVTMVEQFISAQISPTGCHVHLIGIPPAYRGHTYGELCHFLLDTYGAICLGLYRSPHSCRSPMPYVFTAPSSTTAVHDEDKIYVLSKEVPIKDLL